MAAKSADKGVDMHQYVRNGIVVVFALLASKLTLAASITVNTATDDFGSVGANCSLREAVQSANNNADFGGCNSTGIYGAAITDVIILPTLGAGGFFTLARIGADDSNSAGDLDIEGNVRIDGVSATNSVIRGDTSDPDSDRHRLVHIISGNVTINDLTLRDGLEDGSTAGGGLRTEPGSTTTLNRVTITLNTAGGNAGGILNRGTMTLNSALVSNNQTREALSGGGGIFNSPSATLTINDSRILNNTVKSHADGVASGGGIFNSASATLTFDNSVLDGNLADGRRLVGDNVAFGGGLYAEGTALLVQSSVTNNEAIGASGNGGGLAFDNLTAGSVDRCVVSFNHASAAGLGVGGNGGGIRNAGDTRLEVLDSVISSNVSVNIGGGFGGGPFRIVRSTIAGNQARQGGGIDAFGGELDMVNSTVIGNQAEDDGGGIDHAFTVVSRIRSSTIVANIANSGQGGGIRNTNGTLEIANTVISGNSVAGTGPDCAGSINSGGQNLLQNGSGCGFAALGNDQIGVNAQLAPAANNGGPTAGSSLGVISGMQTHSPLPNSPLIDRGFVQGCTDTNSQVLTTDQIGRNRAIDGDADNIARCDIGAIEYTDALFGDGFE